MDYCNARATRQKLRAAGCNPVKRMDALRCYGFASFRRLGVKHRHQWNQKLGVYVNSANGVRE